MGKIYKTSVYKEFYMMQGRTVIIGTIRQTNSNPCDCFSLLPERIYSEDSNSRNQVDFISLRWEMTFEEAKAMRYFRKEKGEHGKNSEIFKRKFLCVLLISSLSVWEVIWGARKNHWDWHARELGQSCAGF